MVGWEALRGKGGSLPTAVPVDSRHVIKDAMREGGAECSASLGVCTIRVRSRKQMPHNMSFY